MAVVVAIGCDVSGPLWFNSLVVTHAAETLYSGR